MSIVRGNAGEKIKRTGQLNKVFLVGNQSQDACAPNLRLQLQFQNSTQTRDKLLYMGGVYNSVLPRIGAYDGNGGNFASYFNSWREAIIAAEMGWLGDNLNAQIGKIVGYAFDPTTGLVQFALQAPGVTWPNSDDPVRVSIAFPFKSPLDGTYLVQHTSSTSCTTVQPRPAAPFTLQGTIQLKGTNFISLATLNNLGLTGTVIAQNGMTRKSGRPYYASRGRLSPTVRW